MYFSGENNPDNLAIHSSLIGEPRMTKLFQQVLQPRSDITSMILTVFGMSAIDVDDFSIVRFYLVTDVGESVNKALKTIGKSFAWAIECGVFHMPCLWKNG